MEKERLKPHEEINKRFDNLKLEIFKLQSLVNLFENGEPMPDNDTAKVPKPAKSLGITIKLLPDDISEATEMIGNINKQLTDLFL